MTIEELIVQGQAEMEAARSKQLASAAELERHEEERRLARVALFVEDVRAVTDPVLHPYLYAPVEAFDPSHRCIAEFHVPDCTFISVSFYFDTKAQHYIPNRTPPIYSVGRPTWKPYDGLRWGTYETEHLSWALASAHQFQIEADELGQREEARNAESVRQELEQEEREERRAKADAEQRAAQDRERQALIYFLADDPVAFHLLRAFADIQAERAAWEDKLESASQSMEEIEDGHARRLEAVEKCAQAARRDAEDARARETEARDAAERAERKLKQVQRGV